MELSPQVLQGTGIPTGGDKPQALTAYVTCSPVSFLGLDAQRSQYFSLPSLSPLLVQYNPFMELRIEENKYQTSTLEVGLKVRGVQSILIN